MDFKAHLKSLSVIYKQKCDMLIDALRKYCPKEMDILIPDGGMFTWVTFPDDVDCATIYERQFSVGVGAVPSIGFAVDTGRPWHAFRLNYTCPTSEEIDTGIRKFGDLCCEIMKQS